MNKNYQKIIFAFIIAFLLLAYDIQYAYVYLAGLLVVILYIMYETNESFKKAVTLTQRKSEYEIKEIVDENEYHSKILSNLIKTMSMPMIFVDKDGIIVFTNQAFRNAFNIEHLRGKEYKDLFSGQLLNIVEQSYVFENKLNTVVNIDEHYYQIESTPLFKDDIVFDGTIILFTDVSQMKEIEKMQKQFFSDVSHELKTPMAAIIGSVEILQQNGIKDEKTFEEFMGILLKESNRMQGIINDILELARLEQPKSQIEYVSVNIKEAIKECVQLFESVANEKNISLIYHCKIEEEVTIDFATLKTTLNNLVSNAIKYSDGGVVTIKSEIKNNDLIIRVQDEGIGISQEHLPFIFDRFYQVDRSRTSKKSTGLGLSIVKKMVELNNGTIKVESVPGVGTMFKVKIPLTH